MTQVQSQDPTLETRKEKVNFAVKGWFEFVTSAFKKVTSGEMEQEEFLERCSVLLKVTNMAFKASTDRPLTDMQKAVIALVEQKLEKAD